MSKDRLFKLWRENFFGRKKSFVQISDFKTGHEFIQVGNPCFIEIQSDQTSCFYLCFLFAKPTSKSYKFFTKLFQTSKFLHKKYVG